MYEFKLYVMGQTPSSIRAINNLKSLLENDFKDQYILKILDLLKNPELSGDDKIFATPTLVKVSPLPQRRIIGDLKDKDKVSVLLLR